MKAVKRGFAILLVLLMSLSLFAVCSAEDPGSDCTIEAKTFPMRVQRDSKKEARTGEITLYFMNGGDIPYVALSEYMPFVGSLYADEDLNIPAAEYEISHPFENHTMVQRRDNLSFMDIDAEKDTIEFVGMDLFTAAPGSTVSMSVISLSADGRGGISNLLHDSGSSYDRTGSSLITFDMTEYLIDLVEQDGECYVPMQTVNDLLVSQNYMYVVFNREEVLASTYSGDLINEMYNAPTGEMSEEFALFNYNELRFMLDSFYGLKPEHGIENFGDFFDSTGLLGALSGTDPVAFDMALRRMTMKYFDDGHSGLLKNSYLSGDIKPEGEEAVLSVFHDIGSSSNDMLWERMRIKGCRQEFYPDHPELDPFGDAADPWFYEEVGDTAILTFDVFSADKRDYYTEADLEQPGDTIELIAYAHSQITREDSPIRNVVVDLSCNGGGAADAAVYLMAWLKNDATAVVALKDTLTGAQSICSYAADINLDGEFDFDDWLPSEISRYCLISSLSFSCGNLVPAALKGAPNVTLLGRTSGGGSCVVRPCTTASGAVFLISSPKQISYVRNGSLYNVDQGTDPDCFISRLDTMYDRQKLVDFIHDLP